MMQIGLGIGLGIGVLGIFVVGLVAVAVIGYLVTIYNGLVRLKNDILKAWSNIDVLLKQRSDELTKLLATVKGYMKYEKGVLESVTKARTAFLNANTIGEKAAASDMMTGALKTLFAVAENYPKLEADQSFKQLQERISGLENEIADRREFYNEAVNEYNIRIQSIPDSVVAAVLGLKPQEMFKVSEEEKKDVKIDL